MLWTDVNDIAVELFEKFPDLDPTYILFTDLREMIMNLENFEDDPDRSNEKILATKIELLVKIFSNIYKIKIARY